MPPIPEDLLKCGREELARARTRLMMDARDHLLWWRLPMEHLSALDIPHPGAFPECACRLTLPECVPVWFWLRWTLCPDGRWKAMDFPNPGGAPLRPGCIVAWEGDRCHECLDAIQVRRLNVWNDTVKRCRGCKLEAAPSLGTALALASEEWLRSKESKEAKNAPLPSA